MGIFAWVLLLFMFSFMFPWAHLLLRNNSSILLLVLTTFGFSIGTLTLAMLWLNLTGLAVDWRVTFAICSACCLIGIIVLSRIYPLRRLPTFTRPSFSFIVIAIMSGLVLGNAVYWPFAIDDSVTIYAWYGKFIAQTQHLPTLSNSSLYEAYPMLVPLAYAFTHQASGWINEYLAAAIPAILSIGAFWAAFQLGSELFGQRIGVIAALICVLTPAVTFWASASYTDLPCAFFYTLSMLYLWRAFKMKNSGDAFAAGLMGGLAAWTKNSGLLIAMPTFLWFTYKAVIVDRKVNFRAIFFWLAGFALAAAPWYIRNLIGAGFVIPPTGWTEQAQRTLSNLVPYLSNMRYYPVAPLLALGMWAIFLYAIRTRLRTHSSAFLSVFIMPFFFVWWLLFSYDIRFLLVILPCIAIAGAWFIDLGTSFLAERLVFVKVPRWSVILLLFIAIPAASTAIDHKFELLRSPLATDEDKHRTRLGARYQVALYLRSLPPQSRVWTKDLLIPYHADGIRVTTGMTPTFDQFCTQDYWVRTPNEPLPEYLTSTPIYQFDMYEVYKSASLCIRS